MKNTMILTPERAQKRKDAVQALDSLKYNTMCYDCKKFLNGCGGTVTKVWDGCIWHKKTDFPSVYALAAYAPELIKNEDFFSYDEFLGELINNRNSVIVWLESRLRGEHFKNEILSDNYINACKKILELLKEV